MKEERSNEVERARTQNHPENPENLAPCQKTPKEHRKTLINHANHRYLEGAEEQLIENKTLLPKNQSPNL